VGVIELHVAGKWPVALLTRMLEHSLPLMSVS